jgi:hypothetical protein
MARDLAQLNIARLAAPLDSPQLADFVANLERINALGEASPGFIWRLKDDSGDATALRPFGDDVIVNLTVWKDVESLRAFVYKSAHVEIFRRRREWFRKPEEASLVLWWVAPGHRPSLDEAWEKLQHLRRNGPTQLAFGFRDALEVAALDP